MEEEDVNEMKRNSRKRFMRNNEEGKGGRARNETKKIHVKCVFEFFSNLFFSLLTGKRAANRSSGGCLVSQFFFETTRSVIGINTKENDRTEYAN